MDGFKRKEDVVHGVRRLATQRLDRVIAALCAPQPAAPAEVLGDLHRVAALVAVCGPSMDAAAARRERQALRSAIRRATPRYDARAALDTFLKARDGRKDAGTTPRLLRDDAVKPTRRPAAAGVPDPAVHRLIAELSEVRMRAGYWHVQGRGFAVLGPGLRSAYRAARLAASAGTGAAALLPSVRTLAQGLRLIERAWPALIAVQRRALRDAGGALSDAAGLEALRVALRDDNEAARKIASLLAEQRDARLGEARALLRPFWAETPGRFVDRHAGYWAAWRGDADGAAGWPAGRH